MFFPIGPGGAEGTLLPNGYNGPQERVNTKLIDNRIIEYCISLKLLNLLSLDIPMLIGACSEMYDNG